jgi:hypothetical protein
MDMLAPVRTENFQQYRESAAEVRRVAQRIGRPSASVEVLAIAERYERLAARIERKETAEGVVTNQDAQEPTED